ncbi:hypothetical protein FXB40_03545 [Bradyrhizobium rifense]|uniref:Uncharacterized protein n=1 Tax=Bradyrhizobium rifense TaxID=515499 RepID=A0A5D3KN52_9BRAD|nr:hypothetical protein FXB40_03545 [Bradyrhizobium rifense]
MLFVLRAAQLMGKAAGYAISVGIVGFGAWVLVAGLYSSAPAFWVCVALVPIAVGVWSACGHI